MSALPHSLTRCARCTLVVYGEHATAEDCLRHLVPRIEAAGVRLKQQAADNRRLILRAEKLAIQFAAEARSRKAIERQMETVKRRNKELENECGTLRAARRELTNKLRAAERKHVRYVARIRRLV